MLRHDLHHVPLWGDHALSLLRNSQVLRHNVSEMLVCNLVCEPSFDAFACRVATVPPLSDTSVHHCYTAGPRAVNGVLRQNSQYS